MLILILALLAQDPNVTYQNLDRAAKERIYLVYDREVRARQNVDAAVDATSKATSLPGGAIRLVVIEMKRDPKFIEQRKTAARGLLGKKEDKDKKKPTTRPRRNSSSLGGGGSSGRVSTRNRTTTEKKYSGDGIAKEEGEEKAKFNGKDMKIAEFHHACRYVTPEDLEKVNDKVAVVVDGQIHSPAKDYFVIDVVGSDGALLPAIVVLRIASTERLEGIHKGDRVRLWGFFADESQIKAAEDAAKEDDEDEPAPGEEEDEDEKKKRKEREEKEARPNGRVFFVMDVDQYTRQIPGLELTCRLKERDDTSGKKRYWDIEVEAKNAGDRPLSDIEVEANVTAGGVKPKSAVDSVFVYFEKLEPGKSSVVKTKLVDWREIPEEDSTTTPANTNTFRFVNPQEQVEDEEVEVYARSLGGRVSK